MRIRNPGDPVYAPNSVGGPAARPEEHGERHTRWATGELMRAAYAKHAEDDDFGQARTLIEKVLGGSEVDHLVDNIVGHASKGVSGAMQDRVVEYWSRVQGDLGDRVASGLGRSASDSE